MGDEQCVMGTRGREWPLEMTFDGGAREVNGRRVASAGAVIGKYDYRIGGMAVIRRAVIGLPGEAHAQVAEAYGCRIGLKMLLGVQCDIRAARAAGDNLNEVRYCASEGRCGNRTYRNC